MSLTLTAILLDECLMAHRAKLAASVLVDHMGPTDTFAEMILAGQPAWSQIVDILALQAHPETTLDEMWGLKRRPDFAGKESLLKEFNNYAQEETWKRQKAMKDKAIRADPDAKWIRLLEGFSSYGAPNPDSLKDFKFKMTARNVKISGPGYACNEDFTDIVWSVKAARLAKTDEEAKIAFIDFLQRRMSGTALKIKRSPRTPSFSMYN